MDGDSSAVLPAVPETPAPVTGGFWYCEQCTKLIHPPGSAGVVLDDKHYCPGCAPVAKFDSSKIPLRASKASIPLPHFQQPTPVARGTKAIIKPASAAANRHASDHHVATAPKKPLLVIGLALGGVVLVIGLIASLGGDSTKDKYARIARTVPAATDIPTKIAETPETKTGPRLGFLTPAEPRRDPEFKEAPRAAVPPPPQPTFTPQPVQILDTKPADNGLTAFKVELMDAAKFSERDDFSAAMNALSRLKALHGTKDWWAQQQPEVAAVEKRVQEQLAEFLAEAEDIRVQAAKSEKPEFLDKIEATWKAPKTVSEWSLLDIVSLQAENGVVLARLEDGSVLVGGENPDRTSYTLVMQTRLEGITAIRLDTLRHDSLHNGGPGRRGNFVLGEFSLQAASGDDAYKPVTLVKPRTDFAQGGAPPFLIENTIDNNPATGWAVVPHEFQPHTAIYETASPLNAAGGLRLTAKLDFQTQWVKHVIGRFRISATASKAPPGPDVSAPVGSTVLGDQRVAQVTRQILKAVADSRQRMAEQIKQKRSAEILAKLDSTEKLIKQRPRIVDGLKKSLDEAEALIIQDAELIEKFAERSSGMRFDMNALRDGDLSLYNAPVKMMGNAADISYDFGNAAEFSAWSFDNPATCGNADLDPKKRAVLLRTVGGHNWDAKDRRGTPVFRLPFYFRPENWMIEAEVELVSDGNKGNKPDFGILVWDGSSSVVRFAVQEAARGISANVSGSNPARENFWLKPVMLNGKIREKTRIQMTCTQGIVTCTATNAAGQTLKIGKETLGFEPRYTGFFVRTSDGGDNAQASFNSFHMQGVPNTERLKEVRDIQRAIMARDAKLDLARRGTALKLIQDGRFIPIAFEKAATRASTTRLFNGTDDTERLLFPSFGLMAAGGIPFIVADPKGDAANNIIVLHSPLGTVANTMPKSVSVACNSSGSALHILGGVSGWGFPNNGTEKTVSAIVRLHYEDGKTEDHQLLSGVHLADFIRVIDVPESKLAFKLGEQQIRYLSLKIGRPEATIKTIELLKGDDKSAPVFAALTLDKKVLNPFLSSAVKNTAEGKVGKALNCRSNQDYVDVQHAAELEPLQFTVECWVWLDEFNSNGEKRRWLVNKNGHESTPGHYGLFINDKNVGAYICNDKSYMALSPDVLKLKQWQHLAMTFDEKDLKVYVDGALVVTMPVNTPRPQLASPFTIGRRQDGHAQFTTGMIDEVRLYKRALNEAELKARLTDPQKAPADGLVGHWNFD